MYYFLKYKGGSKNEKIVLALVLMLILTPLTVHGQGEVLGVKGYL